MTTDRSSTLAALRTLTATHVVATYSGSGDSGSIDEIDVFSSVNRTMAVDQSVLDAILELFYAALEEKFAGWEINDGSDGTITWTIETDKIHIDHEQHYTASDHEEADL